MVDVRCPFVQSQIWGARFPKDLQCSKKLSLSLSNRYRKVVNSSRPLLVAAPLVTFFQFSK